MVIYELVSRVCEIISNSDNPRFEAELIVMSAMNLTRTEYVLRLREEADAERAAFEMAERRKRGEPLAYIIGSAEFMGMKFKVTPSTLIPRQDTETLVEKTADYIGSASARVLDIGTGSGCVGISIASLCKNTDVTLLDISPGALKTAEENAELNGVKVNTLLCDIMTDIPKDKFDVIVSNPPYIKSDVIKTLQTEVKDYEPITALDGGYDGLMFYRRICLVSRELLNEGGLLAFETGYDEADEVSRLMTGFADVTVCKDLSGNDRVVYGRKK